MKLNGQFYLKQKHSTQWQTSADSALRKCTTFVTNQKQPHLIPEVKFMGIANIKKGGL